METTHHFPSSAPIAHRQIGLGITRIGLGVFLLIKGLLFAEYASEVFRIVSATPFLSGHYSKATMMAGVMHIVGGTMIAVGYQTRIAALLQIPILLGAVFLVNMQQGIRLDNMELWVSTVVLALLLLILIMGAGRPSFDATLGHE
ncbi:DoxX family protein [Hymenobacter sp. GOD-10R]|uniref:DoxX family protein n=1 Tax=Hymenobacter sp. GOD-10R TaxID=3093922 RepID=UPI002D76D0C7|nr:DoxX family protein [Hymenobacter sp. GOD-10R]WRQ27652.1 DoxX family protein [Hymenobacter sp. GOD-10R]